MMAEARNAILTRGEFEPPLLEFEYELPLDILPQEAWQTAVEMANERLSVLEGDLRIFTPVDTGALVRSLLTKSASVFDASIGAGYTEPYGWWVNYGTETFDGYHWFERIVQAHIERLQGDLLELARRLAFPGEGIGFFGV